MTRTSTHRTKEEDSEFIGHEPCPECGSKDNLARYTDGHAYCFGCEYFEAGVDDDGQRSGDPVRGRRGSAVAGMIQDVEHTHLIKRGLTEETCQKFGYGIGTYKGKTVQVANYRGDDGRIVAQHIRSKSKKFAWLGDSKKAVPLWGQQLWRDVGRKIVVTEGEIDCMSVSQLQGNRWPVVSIKNGAQGAKRDVKKALEFLSGFDDVIFMFDMDEPGQDAARECALLLPPGKAKIATLPLKDANEMLMAHRGDEVVGAVWEAKGFRPDGIVTLADLKDEVMKPVDWGMSWVWDTMTNWTYGRRLGEVYGFGAGTGVGKTDLFTQQIAYDITVLGEKVGLFYLEQQPVETAKRVAGKVAHQRFHVPDAGWTQEQLTDTWDKLMEKGKLFLYDHFGVTDWDVIQSRIRYLAVSEGVRLFYLDHLTALAAGEEDERKALEFIMADLGGLVKELDIIVHYISHLATPDGRPHEEGGRVMVRHFKGSRAIGYWSHFMFGLERDCQAEDETERNTATVRCLKDRYTGTATGHTFDLIYDDETGLLTETGNPFTEGVDDDIPF